jgi:hypothetical protein
MPELSFILIFQVSNGRFMSHLQSFWKNFPNKEFSVPGELNIASLGFKTVWVLLNLTLF